MVAQEIKSESSYRSSHDGDPCAWCRGPILGWSDASWEVVGVEQLAKLPAPGLGGADDGWVWGVDEVMVHFCSETCQRLFDECVNRPEVRA